MKHHFPLRRIQRGAAAVEFALLLPLFLVIVTVPLVTARCLWHYTAAQKAAFDAARYLSGISAQEMREPALAVAAADIAREIVETEIEALKPGGTYYVAVDIRCGDNQCREVRAGTLPDTITVGVSMNMYDQIFGVSTGRYGVPIEARYEIRYAGR